MESARNPDGRRPESNALAGARPVPSRPVPQKSPSRSDGALGGVPPVPPSQSLWKSTDADASESLTRSRTSKTSRGPRTVLRAQDEPTHALLCMLAKHVMNRQPALGRPGADQGDAEEALKVAAARAGLAYSSETVRKAVDAVLHVRHRGARV